MAGDNEDLDRDERSPELKGDLAAQLHEFGTDPAEAAQRVPGKPRVR